MNKTLLTHKVADSPYRIHFRETGSGYVTIVLDDGEGLYDALVLFPYEPDSKGLARLGDHRYGVGLVWGSELDTK